MITIKKLSGKRAAFFIVETCEEENFILRSLFLQFYFQLFLLLQLQF